MQMGRPHLITESVAFHGKIRQWDPRPAVLPATPAFLRPPGLQEVPPDRPFRFSPKRTASVIWSPFGAAQLIGQQNGHAAEQHFEQLELK